MSDRGGAANFYAALDSDVPSFYDRLLGPVFFVDFADDIARRTAATTPLKVLETAAGTGIVSRRLRDLLPAAAQLTVTDLNAAMLDVARGKFTAKERVDIEPADAAALPFPDASFEALVCQFGLMFVPDKARAFREAHRVLAEDGRYLFSVWDSQRHNPVGRLSTEIAAAFFPADPPRFFEAPYSYHRIDPIKDGLHEAGFREIRVEVLSREQIIPDVAAFARALVHGSPFISEIRARGGVDPERVIEALRDALSREFGTVPARMPLQAIVFEATRR